MPHAWPSRLLVVNPANHGARLTWRGVNRGKINFLGAGMSDHLRDRQRIVVRFRESWPTRSTRPN